MQTNSRQLPARNGFIITLLQMGGLKEIEMESSKKGVPLTDTLFAARRSLLCRRFQSTPRVGSDKR